MADAITSKTVLEKTEAFVQSDVDDETVLMNLDDGKFSSLSAVGQRIWQLIDGKAPVSQICEALTDEFDVDAKACESETLAFLGNLQERGLIAEIADQ